MLTTKVVENPFSISAQLSELFFFFFCFEHNVYHTFRLFFQHIIIFVFDSVQNIVMKTNILCNKIEKIGSVFSYNLHTIKVHFDPHVRDLQHYLVQWVQIFPTLKTPQVLNLSTSNWIVDLSSEGTKIIFQAVKIVAKDCTYKYSITFKTFIIR